MQTLALQSLVGESQEAEAATRQSRALWEPRGNTPKCQRPESAGDMVPREKKQKKTQLQGGHKIRNILK